MDTRLLLALAILMIAFERFRIHVATAQPTIARQSSSTNRLWPRESEAKDYEVKSAETKPSNRYDNRRSIWALAHMVNSIKELNYRLRLGANAVEADVTFSRDGEPLHTYHGPPCDCWRHCHQQENFNEYLSFIREISIDTSDGIGQNLSLLFLDLKLDPLDQRAKERAGQKIAYSVMNNLFIRDNQQNVHSKTFYLIVSINHINDIDLVRNFIHTLEVNNASYLLNENIGFDVGMNDDLEKIEAMWRKFANGANLNLWQGDGFTNCLSPFYNLERLSKAIAKRDDPEGYPTKVYHWTIDLHDRMRESLHMGVDGIMTNHPERLLSVLMEPTIAHDFRLATREDNPFRKMPRRSSRRGNETSRYQRSAHITNGGLLYNLLDVMSSVMSYIKEIPFLSYPTTLISRSSSGLGKHMAADKPIAPRDTSSLNVTKVNLQAEPEYRVNVNTSDINTANQERQLQTQQLDNAPLVPSQDTNTEYEGPKWYTSLLSSMLISVMRVLLPPVN